MVIGKGLGGGVLGERSLLKMYSDGASRGNPGPSAIGFIIIDGEGKLLKRFGEFIGYATNNRAEYTALIKGLGFAASFKASHVHCFLDSQLVVRQLRGEYRVRDEQLRSLWLKVKGLERSFQGVTYTHLSREDPWIASVDRMVNRVLDAHLKGRED